MFLQLLCNRQVILMQLGSHTHRIRKHQWKYIQCLTVVIFGHAHPVVSHHHAEEDQVMSEWGQVILTQDQIEKLTNGMALFVHMILVCN